ncbi:MAG: M48 family metalloprotease [Proteobacteria bacterium]|nr:M48 family metalloprotease [Pseudomonadota bacterium]
MQFFRKILVVCLSLIVLAGGFLPQEAAGITVKEEEELSREFMKIVLSRFPLIKDPIIVNYVNEIGQKIVALLPPQPFNYRFYVLKDNTFNAFASPAGHIFINSGLLLAMENESELAGIITHEVVHVLCRHISQKIDRSQKIGMATMAGIAVGMLLGAGGSGTAANALTMGSIAAGQSLALAYSREDETQADKIGLNYMNRAGYSAKGLLLILKKIRSRQWFGSDQIPTYLQTHPAVEDRMAYIDAWIANHEQKVADRNSFNFERATTWLFAAQGDENAALQQFESAIKNHPENPMGHYGYGLVLARTGNRKAAVDQLKTALEKKAFDPYILKDLGRIYFLDGRYPEALNTLSAAGGIAAFDPEGLFYLGRTQMEMDRLTDAVVTFENLVAENSDYNQAYYFLGESCGRLGKLADAHYYLGIYYKNDLNYKNAVFHLQKALETMKDPYKKDKIEEMLKESRKELMLQQKERIPG